MAGVIVILLIYLYLNIKGIRKYKMILKDIDKNEYIFKKLLPAGLMAGEILKIFAMPKIRAKIMPLICELKGEENIELHYKINVSYSLVLVFLSFLIIFAIGSGRKFDIGYIVFVSSMIAFSIVIPKRILKNKLKIRKKSIRNELPGFVNRLVLLVNAGFNIKNAWKKIASESKKNTPLYSCVKKTAVIMESNRGEKTAYEYFSKTLRDPDATRIVSLILQNHKKGNQHIVPLLKIAAQSCFEKKRSSLKIQGEEASVKLLFPMSLLMLSVIIIVAAPALSALLNM